MVPGNYGIDFLDQYGHGLQLEDAVKCSNFVGEALDAAVEFGAKGVLLVGHIGKFVKLAGGIMNTPLAQCRCANGASDCSRGVVGCTGGAASEDDGVCDYR